MKRKVLSIILLSLLASCSFFNGKPVEDSRFNGTFFNYYHWEDSDGIEETTRSYMWVFDGTTKASQFVNLKSYRIGNGWTIIRDNFDMEIETKDNRYFRSRLWDNSFDDWSDWQEYEFLEDGTLRLYDEFGYDDYTKEM